jgi:hypothetical protein
VTLLDPFGSFAWCTSVTLGLTWSVPHSVCGTAAGTLPKSACGGAMGPGVGLQLRHAAHEGRILFIGHFGAYVHDYVWFSDDGGAKWRVSNSSLDHMDEAQLVELPGGTVQANLRSSHYNKTCDCRAVSYSTDGGASFGPVQWEPTLKSPVCAGTILSGRGEFSSRVFFANPASTTSRVNGIVRRSNDGRVWTADGDSHRVWPGAYGYSCLSNMPDASKMGLLWETNGEQCTGSGASCRSVFSVFDSNF